MLVTPVANYEAQWQRKVAGPCWVGGGPFRHPGGMGSVPFSPRSGHHDSRTFKILNSIF